MKLHTLLVLLHIFIFVPGYLVAQDEPQSNIYESYSPSGQYNEINQFQPTRFNLQTGALFSSHAGGGSLFSTYVNPSFNQPLGKKFYLSAGAVISNTTYNNLLLMNGEGGIDRHQGNITTFTIYTAGSYRLNDRVTIGGSAYKTLNPAFNERLNPDRLSMEAQGVSFGIGYKVNDNFHIGGEIRFQQSTNNLYYPYFFPTNQPMHRSLFGY